MSYPPSPPKKVFYTESDAELRETDVDYIDILEQPIHYPSAPEYVPSPAPVSSAYEEPIVTKSRQAWNESKYATGSSVTANSSSNRMDYDEVATTVAELELFRLRADGSFSNPLRPKHTYEEVLDLPPRLPAPRGSAKPPQAQSFTQSMFGNWRRRIIVVSITALVIGGIVGTYLGLSSASKSSEKCTYGSDVANKFGELESSLGSAESGLSIPGLDPATCTFISSVVNNTVQALRTGGMNCWQNVQTALMPLASASMFALSIANIQQIINSVKQYCVATTTTPAITSTFAPSSLGSPTPMTTVHTSTVPPQTFSTVTTTPTTSEPTTIQTTTTTSTAGTTAVMTTLATTQTTVLPTTTITSTVTSTSPTLLQTTTTSLVTTSTGVTTTLAPSTTTTVPAGTTTITVLEPTTTTTLYVSSSTSTTIKTSTTVTSKTSTSGPTTTSPPTTTSSKSSTTAPTVTSSLTTSLKTTTLSTSAATTAASTSLPCCPAIPCGASAPTCRCNFGWILGPGDAPMCYCFAC